MPSSRCCFSTGSRRLLILLSLVSLGKPYWLSMFPVHNSSFCEAPHALPYTSACLVPPSSSFSVFSSRQCSDVVWSVPLPILFVTYSKSLRCCFTYWLPSLCLFPIILLLLFLYCCLCVSCPHHPDTPDSRAGPPLVHPLHSNGEPQAGAKVVPQ